MKMAIRNTQATAAGEQADEIIKQLANPGAAIETEKTTVEVLDQAQPVEGQIDSGVTAPADNWENRYKGYKSSTDSTIHSLRQQVQQFDLMKDRLDGLESENNKLKEHIPQTPDEMMELFSKEELDGFNKLVDGKVGDLQGEVRRLQSEAELREQERAEEMNLAQHRDIVSAVARSVPEYAKVDVDPAFSKYMSEPDSFGNIRLELLKQAKALIPPDIGRIVQFYKDFVAMQPKQGYTQQELLQTPQSTPASGVTTPQATGRIWTQALISQFYKDRATGKIGKEEATELEKEMYASLGAKRN